MKPGIPPQWLNISELPRVAWMIDGMLQAATEVHSSLQAAKQKPLALDAITFNRIYEVQGDQLEDLWLYEEQLRRFEKEKATVEQDKEIDRLASQVIALRTTLVNCLKLADEISQSTMNTIMAMDDLQRELEVVLGKRMRPIW